MYFDPSFARKFVWWLSSAWSTWSGSGPPAADPSTSASWADWGSSGNRSASEVRFSISSWRLIHMTCVWCMRVRQTGAVRKIELFLIFAAVHTSAASTCVKNYFCRIRMRQTHVVWISLKVMSVYKIGQWWISVWPDLVKFRHFDLKFKVLGKFWRVNLVLCKF